MTQSQSQSQSQSQFADAKQVLSTLTDDGRIVVSLEPDTVEAPGEDEVIVEMHATPINPSDLLVLLGPAKVETARKEVVDGHPALVADIEPKMAPAFATRVGQRKPVGNEGAGVVVAAGSSPKAQALLGKTVTLVGGGMYRTHRRMRAIECVPLPEGAPAQEGASLFVNPMTVQAFIDTMREEGHEALVHTAAASNLGQMLAKLCAKEGIPLVAIVRSQAQREILEGLGVEHIIDSTKESFVSDLIAALVETKATLAFDAIGGGDMANKILIAMEQALIQRGFEATQYGVAKQKQVYIYGRLDLAPTVLTASYGLYWSVAAWLVTPRLQKAGMPRVMAMRQFAVEERNGIFHSSYTDTIGLEQMLDPDTLRTIERKSTGRKFLVDPSR